MPRFRSIGLAPAATDFAPSLTMACASTVAVVVPSPATSEVLLATSFNICAPMFSNLSSSSISLATVTPSLVMRGAPNDLSSTTLRPFGPSVALTALARMLTPRSILARESSPKRISLAAMWNYLWGMWKRKRVACGGDDRSAEDGEDVVFLHDEQVGAIELHFGAGVLAEQHLVADLDLGGTDRTVIQRLAFTDGDHFALDRLLGGRVRDNDPAGGHLFFFHALDDDAVVQRLDIHWQPLSG